jgi:hypothetical protein
MQTCVGATLSFHIVARLKTQKGPIGMDRWCCSSLGQGAFANHVPNHYIGNLISIFLLLEMSLPSFHVGNKVLLLFINSFMWQRL